ncbi:hypothetical protein BE20_30925 [Sorangium cellulosum]|nr:hypothetical protein BE20_30925 [Sorangium cellulosum]
MASTEGPMLAAGSKPNASTDDAPSSPTLRGAEEGGASSARDRAGKARLSATTRAMRSRFGTRATVGARSSATEAGARALAQKPASARHCVERRLFLASAVF